MGHTAPARPAAPASRPRAGASAGLGSLRDRPRPAKSALDQGTHPDDLPFLAFLTGQEAQVLEGMAYLALGQTDRATTMLRTLPGPPDATHPRNAVNYRLMLAGVEFRLGDVCAAGKSATAGLPGVLALDSSRTSRRLRSLRDELALHRRVPEARAFVDAYDERVAG